MCGNSQILVRTASSLWNLASDTASTLLYLPAVSRETGIAFISPDPMLWPDVVVGLLEPETLKFIAFSKQKSDKNEVAWFVCVFITVTVETDIAR